MKPNLSSHAHRNLVNDPYELDAALMPYSTQADYAPIPPQAIGILFPLEIFDCDFNAIAAGDVNCGGTREGATASREYTFNG